MTWKFMNETVKFSTVLSDMGLQDARKTASASQKVVPAFYLLSKWPINH